MAVGLPRPKSTQCGRSQWGKGLPLPSVEAMAGKRAVSQQVGEDSSKSEGCIQAQGYFGAQKSRATVEVQQGLSFWSKTKAQAPRLGRGAYALTLVMAWQRA